MAKFRSLSDRPVSRKIDASGARSRLPDRSQGLDQRRVITRILDHGRQESVGDERRYGSQRFSTCGGIGVRQGTGGAKAFLRVGLRIIEHGPQPLVDPRLVLPQDAPDHRQFDGRGRQETVVEILGLSSVIGPQGEAGQAGAEMAIAVVLGTRQQPGEWTTRPAAVALELLR